MKSDRIPFSWTLLLIALLHFSVWSIGVSESHSTAFFLRHTKDLNTCYSPRLDQAYTLEQTQDTYTENKHLFSHNVQEQLKSSAVLKVSDKQNLVVPITYSAAVVAVLFFSFLCVAQESSTTSSSSAAAANAANSFPSAIVI